MTDKKSHQEQAYDAIQGAKPCVYRGELELKTQDIPGSACCKPRTIVKKAKFFCKLFNKYLTSADQCWPCKDAKG